MSKKKYFLLGISHKVQNAQSSSYTRFQIILCKIDLAPKGFSLVQAGLKWAFWLEKKEPGLRHFKSKKQNNSINQFRNHFLTSGEMPSKNYFFRLTLVNTYYHIIWYHMLPNAILGRIFTYFIFQAKRGHY